MRQVMIAAAAAALATGPVTSASVQPERRAGLRAEIGAVVPQVLKENGEAVRASHLLVRLDDTAIRDNLMSADEAVRKSIVRHMQRGEDRVTAAGRSTDEIGLAVAATTLSIVAVFVPVAFLPGVSGEWFRPFGVTVVALVVAVVLVGLFISFTLAPMLSACWGDAPGHHQLPKRGISKVMARAMSHPLGYGPELAAASRDQQELFKQTGIPLVSGVALVVLILVMQFSSFTAPLAVKLSLPLSLIGVVLALLLTGGTLTLMTTFALIAGMLPVAIGVGEGGEFHRPMAVAIIGGTITSTVLTLLVIPSFYDSIETSRDRAVAKFLRRTQRWNPFFAFVVRLLEALLTLVFMRFVWRLLVRAFGLVRRRPARVMP